MKKQILFIINPISGTRQKQSIPKEIASTLDHTRFDYEVKYTTHAGHAAELAAEAATCGTDIVVAVGGDGTINEVARSLVHTSTALGIIPCGSGNGLARHLQIPPNPKRAISILNSDVVHCLDYGRINGTPFFCTCGMGFDAVVSQRFAESGKRGLLQYAKDTIGSGISYKSENYTITDDTGRCEQLDAFLITCANASQYGNNAYIAPTASMKDGLMDIVIMRPFPTIEGAHVLLQMFTKTLMSNSHVLAFRASKIHVTRSSAGPIHCDGDPIMMGTEIDVELFRRSFNVVVNPEAHSHRKNFLQELGERLDDLFNIETLLRRSQNDGEGTEKLQEATYDVADRFSLQRFVDAQASAYAHALEEIKAGQKRSHWMWFVFPQMHGLGHSTMSKHYAITCREEAEQYLLHPILGQRLMDITAALLHLPDTLSAHSIFGSPDDLKLRSCMTLFSSISEEGNVFEKVLNRYFNGQPCQRTLTLLNEEKE